MDSISRCYNHKERTELPRLCAVCQRIAVEREILLRTVDALLAAGYALQTFDTESHRPEQPTLDKALVVKELMEVDDEYLIAEKDGVRAYVRFIYGSDGYDVINDYTVNLEDVLKPINEYADTLA